MTQAQRKKWEKYFRDHDKWKKEAKVIIANAGPGSNPPPPPPPPPNP